MLKQNILGHNDELAAANRAWLAARGVVALNLVSAPGAGKTLLLEKTLTRLRGRIACAVVLTKTDLAPHVDWDRVACRRNVRRIQPAVPLFELSAKTGVGLDAWIDFLAGLARA